MRCLKYVERYVGIAVCAALVFAMAKVGRAAEGSAPTFAMPRVGAVLEPGGVLRGMNGFGGTFLPGAVIATGVISAACGAELCLAKTADEIAGSFGAVRAPEGSALFAVDSNTPGEALIYFPASGELVRFRDGRLDAVAGFQGLAADDQILAIRAVGEAAEMAVLRDGVVRVIDLLGATVDMIADATGAVMLLADGAAAYVSGDELILQRSDGSSVRHETDGVKGLSALGEGYVQVTTERGLFALDVRLGVDSNFGALYRLPASAVEEIPERSTDRDERTSPNRRRSWSSEDSSLEADSNGARQ